MVDIDGDLLNLLQQELNTQGKDGKARSRGTGATKRASGGRRAKLNYEKQVQLLEQELNAKMTLARQLEGQKRALVSKNSLRNHYLECCCSTVLVRNMAANINNHKTYWAAMAVIWASLYLASLHGHLHSDQQHLQALLFASLLQTLLNCPGKREIQNLLVEKAP
eukprot:1154236-Pelagomonas_calceolata.AAC.20